MTPFTLHPQLASDCTVVADAPLSRLLLLDDAQYPWFILVPRRDSVTEVYELNAVDQKQLLAESVALSRALMQAYAGDKLNVAALGNQVPQLHLHHIVRYRGDASWPFPVWGRHAARPYSAPEMQQRLDPLRVQLPADWRWR